MLGDGCGDYQEGSEVKPTPKKPKTPIADVGKYQTCPCCGHVSLREWYVLPETSKKTIRRKARKGK